MSVQTSPCDWEPLYPDCPVGMLMPEPLNSLPASGVDLYEGMAADYLWNWTGKALGVCEVTIKPCRQDCTEGMSSFYGSGPRIGPYGLSGPWTPVIIDGLWYNIGCGRCGDKCGCDGGSPLKIPGPIDSVISILENGEVVDPAAYYVQGRDTLVRTDGQVWSPCDLVITYNRGVQVPNGGRIAAGILANEFAKAVCNDSSCALPKRVQSITRQGVTIAVLDSFDDIDTGHTGIWIIDSWIASMMKTPDRAAVLSPDMPRSSARRLA